MAAEPIFLNWDGSKFTPNDVRDLELCQRIKIGSTVRADKLVHPRNPRRHGLYWAVLTLVTDATGCVPTADHLHDLIKIKTGYVRAAVLPGGEVCWMPDSTAWDAMTEEEFRVYLDTAFQWISDTFGIDVNELQKDAA